MLSKYQRTVIKIFAMTAFTGACQGIDIGKIKESSRSLLSFESKSIGKSERELVRSSEKKTSMPLDEILNQALIGENGGTDFVMVLRLALDNDPVIIAKRRNADAKFAAIGSFEAQRDFQVSSTLYGGLEDVTDNQKGLALALNASRIISDGGVLSAEIASKGFLAEAARFEVLAALDDRALRLCEVWLELEKYRKLKEKIDSRLAVLDPLIDQLERVAKAGIGDASKVTAAQRTVSSIRVTQTNVSEGLAKAELDFTNAFGSVESNVVYDAEFVASLVPNTIDDNLIEASPILRSYYAKYQAGLAKISALQAKEDFKVGFEARIMRPFAGSSKDSDESIGIVANKTIYNGGVLKAEMAEAQALLESGSAQIKSTYREGVRYVQAAQQNIKSMDKAILLAKNNAKLTSTEISYLKQQLVIGGSSLDSVLSAEARLYEAETKELRFTTEKRKSQLLIISTLGILHRSLSF